MSKLAYLFPAFPVFHQTFVLWEVLGLRRNGVSPKIYSLQRPGNAQQPEGQEIAREVTYLPGTASLAVWRANRRLLRRGVRRYLRLYGAVVDAWRTGADAPAVAAEHARQHVTLYNRLRGWFNGEPHVYLLKSLWMVPCGVYFAEQLVAEGITHVHAQWASYPATVAYVAHVLTGVPFSISAHAYDIYMVPRMLPAKLRAARFAVTCAQTNAAFLTRLAGAELGRKVIVNYHGVDVSRFVPAASAIKRAGELTIVSCGQLERYKGMHNLVAACAQLVGQGVTLECTIIGEGPERGQLQRQIDSLGLSAQIHLLGALPHAEVAERLRKADVFALASELAGKSGRRDVIANVIVEAMAAGLAVVASHIPGVEELVDDGVTGYLVAPNSIEELVAAIRKLADHPEERMRFGRAARRRILQDFDSSKNVQRLARLLTGAPTDGAEDRRLSSASRA